MNKLEFNRKKGRKSSNNLLEYIKTGLILFTITAAVALILSAVNGMTKDVITQTKNKNISRAMTEVMPEADKFTEYTEYELPEGIDRAYLARKGEQIKGYCIMCSGSGYGGEIEMAVGISDGMSISGVSIISMNETAGLGARAKEPAFLNQFIGKVFPIEFAEKGQENEASKVNALSGATVTSTAVKDIVGRALLCAMDLSVIEIPQEQETAGNTENANREPVPNTQAKNAVGGEPNE